MKAIISALGLVLITMPAMAQQPNWQAIAIVLRNQRDQANDALVQQQVTMAAQIDEANSKIVWWSKCVSDHVCVTWVNSGVNETKVK